MQAMCGSPVDKLKVLFSIVSAILNVITYKQHIRVLKKLTGPAILIFTKNQKCWQTNFFRAYYELQKTRHSLRIHSSQCSDKVRDTLSARKGPSKFT